MTAKDQNPPSPPGAAEELSLQNADLGAAARIGSGKPSDVAAARAALPVLHSGLTPQGVMEALDTAARKGKVPGLSSEAGKRMFRVVDFGKPFESRLIGVIDEVQGMPGTASRISFTIRMKMLMPVIFAVMLIASVWPGILLTDSMLKLYFSWYTIPTWWWYLPLTVPFVPFAFLKAWKTSIASGRAEAAEIVKGISEVV
ncbi:MAG: hypothetical protein H7210_11175 [Pyrinomonadaceae bacterium]|nr:hypothetical protein [Phycisphaerales bacterium]